MQGDNSVRYLLVLDFQATCIEDKKIQPCAQIIQFPIIVVDLNQHVQVDVFHHYVKPTFNPYLSQFCTQLTGITQQQVDSGHQISVVLQLLDKWYNSRKYLSKGNHVFVTCGDWDLSTCLRQEAKHKKLNIKQYMREYINIKKYYDKVTKKEGKVSGMMQMLAQLNVKHEGKHHSGIDDVRNICKVAIQLHKQYKANFGKQEFNKVKFYIQKQHLQIRYLLVLDFQATCFKDKKIQPCSQIIQFPVKVVDLLQLKVLDTFHHYVKPRFNPKLSQFCTQLTGIRQQMVQNCAYLEDVLVQFDKWISSLEYLSKDNFTFLTCGDWDLAVCLNNQRKHKELKIPKYLNSYINIKKYFFKVVKVREKINGMMDMLNFLKIPHSGKHHSGIDDVENICKVAIQLKRNHKAIYPRSQIVILQ